MPTSRFIVCVLLAAACGTADNRLDPSDLELRDILGIAPETAAAWDAGQRASARHVLEDGLARTDAPVRAALGTDGVIDRRVAAALASIDGDRARSHAGALGLVRVGLAGGDMLATTRVSALEPQSQPIDTRLVGWDAWKQLPARGPGVLATLATDAGHAGGPLVVSPAPRLAAIAGYLPATASEPARLVVNPVLLAALEPAQDVARTASPPPSIGVAPKPIAANPYSFYGSIAECAAAERARCESCLPSSCTAITSLGDGNAECTQFAANAGRGYFLICIDLALAIDSVASCTANNAPSCSFDPHASDSITTLDANAKFLDDAACGGPLDSCLASIFGTPSGDFPGPGSDAGTSPPRNTSVDCGDSCSDSNCDDSVDCELDGPSCDDTQACDGTCADSNDSSGGDCGGGGEDACGSDNTSSCDNGDCGGDSGGDCGGGGGDCSGGGGDCGGGGGDCGGGGGDCNAGKHRARGTRSFSIVWAVLPIPFAVMVRRRAQRRRAEAEYAAREVEP